MPEDVEHPPQADLSRDNKETIYRKWIRYAYAEIIEMALSVTRPNDPHIRLNNKPLDDLANMGITVNNSPQDNPFT